MSTSANRNKGFLLLLLLLRFFSVLSTKNFFQIDDFSKNSHKNFSLSRFSFFVVVVVSFRNESRLYYFREPKKERKKERRRRRKSSLHFTLSRARSFVTPHKKTRIKKRENAKKRERNANRGHESHAFAVASRVRLYRGVHLFLSPHFFFFESFATKPFLIIFSRLTLESLFVLARTETATPESRLKGKT